MGAAGFVTLAGHFTDRSVVTYDPRGANAARKPIQRRNRRPDEHADDLHRIIKASGGGPVDLFASSGGAVNALALVAMHPDDVRTLVAHEPPAASALPDREVVHCRMPRHPRDLRTAGFGPAMARFIALVALRRTPTGRLRSTARRQIRRCSGCRPPMTAGGPTRCSSRTS